MTHIRVITQQSILTILLISNSVNPLLALPVKAQITTKENQKIVGLLHEIKNMLIDKGLEEEVALGKTIKLLQTKEHTLEKLKHFSEGSKLSITKVRLIETLAKYALYEKQLDLSSYSSLIGFTQSVLERPLNKDELEYIQSAVA